MAIDRKRKTLIIQITLFILSFAGATIAGAEWMFGKSLSPLFSEQLLSASELMTGLYFSIPFIGILAAHEFGHYFMAKYYKLKVSLPFFIPFWLGFIGFPSIGSGGAIIKLGGSRSRKEFFDVGIAGPLAGFVIAICVLTYGFTNLPDADYIFEIHPEYKEYGLNYEQFYETQEMNMAVGDNLLFLFFENCVADPDKVPNNYEMYHYPWLFAGYLALFFTAANLLPIGQLDGGHVIYGLFGYKKSRIISRVLFIIMVTVSGIGLIPAGPLGYSFIINSVIYLLFLYLAFHHFEKDLKKRLLMIIWIMIIQIFAFNLFPKIGDIGVYIIFALIIGRFLGVEHPKAIIDEPLDLKRKILGWVALFIFIISFTPRVLYFNINGAIDDIPPAIEEKKNPNLVDGKIDTFKVREL